MVRVMVAAMAAMALVPAGAGARTPGFLSVGRAGGAANLPQVVDAAGRTVLLRGVNADGLVDYRRPDLRPPYTSDSAAYAGGACPADDPSVEGVPLCAADIPQMQALGFDAIRLNLSWSLLEPQPGHIDPIYLDRIAQVVGWARQAGIYVILDMHEDNWSKFIATSASDPCLGPFAPISGADGAPLWASAHVAPACAPGGVAQLSPAVAESFQRLYLNAPAPDGVGLADHYAAVMVALAQRFGSDPAVAGYEIINEPHPGFLAAPGVMDATELFTFYAHVVNTVIARVPGFRQLFFVEPNETRNLTDQGPILTPWSAYSSYRNVVFAPHIYTRVFTADSEAAGQHVFPLDGGYRSAIRDAQVLGLPLWIGEFGNDPNDDETLLRNSYALQDSHALGGTLWIWKENGRWGVYASQSDASPRPSRAKFAARAYPLFTAGTIQSLGYDPDTHAFSLRATSPRVPRTRPARATVVYLPPSATGAVSASNATVRVTPLAGGGRRLVVFPAGGGYGVQVAGS
jgi:endoglycosylceramidase